MRAVILLLGAGGWLAWSGSFSPTTWFGALSPAVLVVMVVVSLLWTFLPRLPKRRYELRVDEHGMVLTADTVVDRISWRDIQHVALVRSHPSRLLPTRVALWPRRGFVPPARHRAGPMMDRHRGLLVFCRPGWLDEPDAVIAAIRYHAAALWDDAHGAAAAQPAPVFNRRRSTRVASAAMAAVLLAIGSIGLISVRNPSVGPEVVVRVASLVWMLFFLFWGLKLTLVAIRPLRMRVDEHGLFVRAGAIRFAVSWNEVRQIGILDEVSTVYTRARQRWLIVESSRTPLNRLGFTTVLHHDTVTGRTRIPLDALAIQPDELDVVFRRFAGDLWRGQIPEPLPARVDGTLRWHGRVPGPLAKLAMILSVGVSAWLTLVIGMSVWLGIDTPVWVSFADTPARALYDACQITLVLFIGYALATRRFAGRCTLRLDEDGLELAVGRSRTRIQWSTINRVDLVPVSRSALAGDPSLIVVWFKDGAPVPRKWFGRDCFVPYSGGVAVVGLSSYNGVQADPVHVRRAIARFAGPAWAPTEGAENDT
ncbi:hypothetical protein [Nocardia gipuzkoensis]